MNISGVVNHIELIVAVAVFVWFFYGPWQSLVVDALRQTIFKMRDDLFLMAADRRISFESPEYKIVRQKLNLLIRYAHAATWTHLLAVSACVKDGDRKPKFSIKEVASKIEDKEVAARVTQIYREALMLTALALVVRSLFLLVVNTLLLPAVLVSMLIDWSFSKRAINSYTSCVERDALASEYDLVRS